MGRHVTWAMVATVAALGLAGGHHAAGEESVTPDVGKKTVLLWPDGAPGALGDSEADKPALTVCLVPREKATGAGVVVCPGGGYAHLADDHEGRQVAAWLNAHGIAAFILKYRIAPYRHPAPMLDAQRALRLVRSRAQEWGVDPNRLGIMGFSAGGHLTSTAGTHFDLGNPDAADPVDRLSCRPDFMVLGYPVITFKPPYAHMGSCHNLLGKDPPAALVDAFSNNEQVTADTPPTFLVHTSGDAGVPAENSILFYLALRKAKVPAELHIYEQGPHGFGLAPDDPVLSTWPGHCIDWMRARGYLSSKD